MMELQADDNLELSMRFHTDSAQANRKVIHLRLQCALYMRLSCGTQTRDSGGTLVLVPLQ